MSNQASNLMQIMDVLLQLELENVLQNSLQELQTRTSLSSQPDEPSLSQ
jgi:hypothetical protein